MKKLIPFLLLTALALPVTSLAAGYALFEGSARSIADAAEMIAAGGDPSTIYLNPAAITDLPGTQVQMGISLVMPQASVRITNPYTGEQTKTSGKEKVWPIPSAYITHQLNDSFWFGFGIYSRFGLGAELNQNWPGRYNSYKAAITSADFNPTIAWKINKKLSISAGLTIRYFDIELAQKIDVAGAAGLRKYNDPAPSPYDVDQNLHGDDVNFALNLGIQFKPTDRIDLGAAYHSRIRFVCHGDGDWTKPDAVNALLPNQFNDTRWKAKNYNPDEIMLGGSLKITDKWAVSLGGIYTLWSVYDDLVIDFREAQIMGRDQLKSEKNWHDVWRVVVGTSYAINTNLTLRGSYTWDDSPLNTGYVDYLVPGDTRHIFALGATYNLGSWTLDGSYFYEVVEDYTVIGRPQNGVYDGKFTDATAHAVNVSLTKRF